MNERLSPVGGPAGLRIVRVFDAPRELVWKEWTEPHRFADWFGGPDCQVPLSTVAMDLRPGGAWTATTLGFGPERRAVRWHGRYLEVVEPERLAFTIRSTFVGRTADLVTVGLVDLGDERAEMLFVQQGQRSPEQYDEARDQWSLEFDHIEERLAENRPGDARRTLHSQSPHSQSPRLRDHPRGSA
jgi:uncharacterized protein YndB with AHSA1/START domain